MAHATRTPRPVTGRTVLITIVAFFGVIIAVNLTLTVFALRSDNGLVVKNSYVASQNFNRNMAEARAQEELGWRLAAIRENGELIVRLHDRDGIAVEGATVTAKVGRPVTARDDRTVELALASDGAFHADLPLGGGKWQADILVTGPAGETYRKIFHFEVEPGR